MQQWIRVNCDFCYDYSQLYRKYIFETKTKDKFDNKDFKLRNRYARLHFTHKIVP